MFWVQIDRRDQWGFHAMEFQVEPHEAEVLVELLSDAIHDDTPAFVAQVIKQLHVRLEHQLRQEMRMA